jgi:hypothetical protein
MKYWLVVLVGLTAVGVWLLLNREGKVTTSFVLPTPFVSSKSRLAENELGLKPLTTSLGKFRTAWEVIPSDAVIRVGINQELLYSSQQLMDQNACRVLTSAAFYDKNNQPLGLLQDNEATLSAWRENELFHGLVGVDLVDGAYSISSDATGRRWKWAVQAGPIVWQDEGPVHFPLSADQSARRVVAGVTADNQLVLLSIMAEDSLYLGPLLGDLPNLLGEWQTATGVVLKSALNLDGGTASAFLSPTLKLRELKPIGSYICVQ